MTKSAALNALTTLLALGFIDNAQRNQAEHHPNIGHIRDRAVDPAYMLACLVEYRIIPENSFRELVWRILEMSLDEVSQEKSAILEAAKLHWQQICIRHNTVLLKTLLDAHLIDQEEFDSVEPEVIDHTLFDSPAALYQWLFFDVYSAEELAAVRASIDADRVFITATERVAIYDEAHLLQEAESRSKRKAKFRVRLLWISILFFSIAIALAGGWQVWTRPEPPLTLTCDSSEAVSAVNGMLFQVKIRAQTDVLRGGDKLPPGRVELRNPQEVGYAKAVPIRGCMGTVHMGEKHFLYAYTITPSANDKGKHLVAGTSMEIVKARFAHIDVQGNFANQAEPVGRDNLAKALRKAADRFSRTSTVYAPIQHMRSRLRARRGDANQEVDPEIREVEPLGPCRALAAGSRYACKVVFEWNDYLLGGFGKPAFTAMLGEFTVEFNQWDDAWRVTADFPAEYMTAISRHRKAKETAAASVE